MRTVWRDLGVLQQAGFPIHDERDGPAVASALSKIEALMTPRGLELVERMRRSIGTAVGAKLQLGASQHLIP